MCFFFLLGCSVLIDQRQGKAGRKPATTTRTTVAETKNSWHFFESSWKTAARWHAIHLRFDLEGRVILLANSISDSLCLHTSPSLSLSRLLSIWRQLPTLPITLNGVQITSFHSTGSLWRLSCVCYNRIIALSTPIYAHLIEFLLDLNNLLVISLVCVCMCFSFLPGSSICILTDVIFYALLLMIASTSNKGKGGTASARARERERLFFSSRDETWREQENNINQ